MHNYGLYHVANLCGRYSLQMAKAAKHICVWYKPELTFYGTNRNVYGRKRHISVCTFGIPASQNSKLCTEYKSYSANTGISGYRVPVSDTDDCNCAVPVSGTLIHTRIHVPVPEGTLPGTR